MIFEQVKSKNGVQYCPLTEKGLLRNEEKKKKYEVNSETEKQTKLDRVLFQLRVRKFAITVLSAIRMGNTMHA